MNHLVIAYSFSIFRKMSRIAEAMTKTPTMKEKEPIINPNEMLQQIPCDSLFLCEKELNYGLFFILRAFNKTVRS